MGFSQVRYDTTFVESIEKVEEFEMVSQLDPNRSAIFSAILPGLGQAYNGQYWKIPIIYGGGIIIGHYINFNHKFYHEFRNAQLAGADNDDGTLNFYEEVFSDASIERNRERFREDRDFLIIIGAVYYLLNIVDAHVSAHLKEFEVNDDLSFSIQPSIQPIAHNTPQAIGMSFTLSIK